MAQAVDAAPLFSVVLPTRDRRELLAEAIESVRAQNCADWELIVVDDASREPVLAVELQQAVGERGRLLAQAEPMGGAAAKSLGAQAARGRFVAFLDDDDLWHPEYLERARRAFEVAPQLNVLFMGVKWFGPRAEHGQQAQDRNLRLILEQTGARRDGAGLYRFDDRLFGALLQRVPMPFQRPVVRRPDFEAIGAYRPECLLWDCDWALRAVLYGECALLDEELYLQRAAGQGTSSLARRAIEHARSNLEIKENLLRHPAVKGTGRQPTVHSALHRDWCAFGWQLQHAGEWAEARDALRAARRHGMSVQLLKTLLRGWARR